MNQPERHSGPGTPSKGDTSADPKLLFACPECATQGWVHWSQLPRGMRCHGCASGFWIDASGHVCSERRAEKIRFKCPRCRRTESLPAELSDHGVECKGCGQRSYLGPDGLFYNRADLEKARRRANKAKREEAKRHAAAAARSPIRTRAVQALALAGLALGLGVLVWLGARLFGSPLGGSPRGGPMLQGAIGDFTRHCAAGELDQAAGYVLPGQERPLELWHKVAFAGGESRGSVEVEIDLEPLGPDRYRARLVIATPGRGEKSQTQYWRSHEGRWRFDAEATLQALRAGLRD